MSNNKDYSSDIDDNTDNTENTIPFEEEVIFPGLIIGKKYILLKKIGQGNNARVWMVYKIPNQTFMAMKIQDYQCYEDGCREVVIIKEINSYAKDHPDINTYCIKMHDYFIHTEDDDVKYVCTVYDLYAGSLQMILNRGKYKYGLPIPIVKNIIRQLLTALDVLHNKLQIIHTDVKPENILFKGISDFHANIIRLFDAKNFQKKYDELVKSYAKNEKKFIEALEILAINSIKDICQLNNEFVDGQEDSDNNEFSDSFIEGEEDDYDEDGDDDEDVDTFESSSEEDKYNERKQSIDDLIQYLNYSEMHNLDIEGKYRFNDVLNNREKSTDKVEIISDEYIMNCETVLIDYGNSYFYKKRTKNEIQDRRYRAPEVILDLNYGYACDIWSVSCVTFELLTGYSLFEPENEPLHKDLQHLYLIEKMLGPIPVKMKKASKRRRFLFDKDRNYHIKNVEKFTPYPLKERLIEQFLFSEKDATQIAEFLLSGFVFEPSKRITAKDMLKHPWLNS